MLPIHDFMCDNELVYMRAVKLQSLGPFHVAIAVPSVTRCRCRRYRGHRCAGGAQQYR